MKTYNVTVKETYLYEGVRANSKEDAIDRVLNFDWKGYDEECRPIEYSAEEMKD